MPEETGIDEATAASKVDRAATEGSAKKEARDSREDVTTAFNESFKAFEEFPEDQLTPDQQAAKNLVKSAKEKTLDRGKISFRNNFTDENGVRYSQQERIPTDELITFLRQRVKSGELPPEEETNYRQWENVLHRNSQEYYRGGVRKEYNRKMARIRQEAERIAADPRLATGDPRTDFLKASEHLFERRELIFPPTKKETTITDTGGTTGPDITEPPVNPPPTNPPPETVEEVRKITIVNATQQIEKMASDEAETQLRDEMRRGSGWNPLNWPRKIALRVGEQYFRQRFIERAREAKIAHNNSFADMDLVNNVARDVNHRIGQERQELGAAVTQLKNGELTAGEKVEEVQGVLRDAVINQVLRPYINGEITDFAQIQQTLRDFVQNHQDDPQVQAIFGHGATDYGRLAEYFATDLQEIAEGIKQDVQAHKYALEQIDKHVSIQFANTSWASESQAHLNAVDKAVAWAQNGSIRGWFLNPAVIGAGASLASFGLFRIAGAAASASRYIVPGVGMVFGAAVAGARRYHDLNIDRAAHQTDMAYNRQMAPNSPRREALERYSYNTASAVDLANRVRSASGAEDTMRAVAEIRTRLDFSSTNHVDLINYESREQVKQGRLQLTQVIVEARQRLKNEGVTSDQIRDLENQFIVQFNQEFTQNREQQDRAFAMYRLRNAAGSAAFAGVAGLASGLLVNEVVAEGQRLTGGHPITFLSAFLKQVGIEHQASAPTATTGPNIDTIKNLYQNPSGGNVDIGNHFTAQVNPDHSVLLTHDGQALPNAPKVELNPDGHLLVHGALPPDVSDQLKSDGFQINQLDAGSVDHKAILGPDGEWTKHSTNVDHREGYDYDRPGSQQNELRLYDSKDGNTVTLNMNHMQLGYQKGLVPNPIDVQQVIANHEAGWYFTLPSAPQDGIWVSDGADGVWDGQLKLDPNDIDPTHIIQTDQGPLQLGEFSKMVLNEQALQQYPDGNLATELYGRQDVFNLGEGNKYGFIEAGRLQDRGGINVLQHFATIRGLGPMPETIDTPIPPTIEIVPPEAPPIPEVGDEMPLIPIPFAPRHPLEKLFVYGYGGDYSRGEMGLLPWNEFRNRRSETLNNNPNAELDERQEINNYLNKQSAEYRTELEQMDAQLNKPMSEKTRVVFAIPAYEEGKNIRKTLEQFLSQKDKDGNPADPALFEIIILDNHPEGIPKDNTEEEIQAFNVQHPEINIIYSHKAWKPEEAGVGRARKYANDLALLRGVKRPNQSGDLILISNDADLDGISDKYVADIIGEFDSKKELDALAGKWTLAENVLKKPNLRAAERLWYILDRVIQRDAAGDPNQRELRTPGLVGRNAAFKASIYAAIGGYNEKAKLAEDLEIGWMINEARGWNPKRVEYLNRAELISNPRRFLTAMVQGIPLIQMYGGFHENREIRQLDNQELLNNIPDNFDLTRFEKEANAIWQAGKSGQYKWLGNRFDDLFNRTMGLLGVRYEIENGQVKITNTDRLIRSLNQPRATTNPNVPINTAENITQRLNQLQGSMVSITNQIRNAAPTAQARLGAEMQRVVTEFNKLTKKAARTPTPASPPTPPPAPPATPSPTPTTLPSNVPTPASVPTPGPATPETIQATASVKEIAPEQRQQIDQQLLNPDIRKSLYTREYNQTLEDAIGRPRVNGRTISAQIPIFIELQNGTQLRAQDLPMGRVMRSYKQGGSDELPPDQESGAISLFGTTDTLAWSDRWGIRRVILGEGDTTYPEGTEHTNAGTIIFDRDKYILENNINLRPTIIPTPRPTPAPRRPAPTPVTPPPAPQPAPPPAVAPVRPGSTETFASTARVVPPSLETTLVKPATGLNQIRDELRTTPGNTYHREITPQTLINDLKTSNLLGDAKLEKMDVRLDNGQLIINAHASRRKLVFTGTADFEIRLANNPNGGLILASDPTQTLILSSNAEGERAKIESQLRNIYSLVTGKVSELVNQKNGQQWEIGNCKIVGNNLAFDFKKKPSN